MRKGDLCDSLLQTQTHSLYFGKVVNLFTAHSPPDTCVFVSFRGSSLIHYGRSLSQVIAQMIIDLVPIDENCSIDQHSEFENRKSFQHTVDKRGKSFEKISNESFNLSTDWTFLIDR